MSANRLKFSSGKAAAREVKQQARLHLPQRAKFFIERTQIMECIHTRGGECHSRVVVTHISHLKPVEFAHRMKQFNKGVPLAWRNMTAKELRLHLSQRKSAAAKSKPKKGAA